LATVNSSSRYAVNAAMSRVNPINASYYCIAQLYNC
jgi:hypothetical protein